MALSPEDKRRILEEETRRLEEAKERERVRKKLEAEQAAKKASKGAAGCLLIVVAVVVYGIIRGGNSTRTNNGAEVAASDTVEHRTRASRRTLLPGSEGKLDNGSDHVIIAVNADAFRALMKASTAKDKEGLMQLLLAGDLFMVPAGTKVRLIDLGFTRSEVRILEGPNYGMSGMVPSDWVVP